MISRGYLCILILINQVVHSKTLESLVRLRSRRDYVKTFCCICDDFSPDPTQRCSVQHICYDNTQICTYCETKRQLVDNSWYMSRSCSDAEECTRDFYHTMAEPHCTSSSVGKPDNGTTCTYCCASTDRSQPHFCSDDPEHNYITFPITTTTPATTTATPTTTTTATTTITTIETTTIGDTQSGGSLNIVKNGFTHSDTGASTKLSTIKLPRIINVKPVSCYTKTLVKIDQYLTTAEEGNAEEVEDTTERKETSYNEEDLEVIDLDNETKRTGKDIKDEKHASVIFNQSDDFKQRHPFQVFLESSGNSRFDSFTTVDDLKKKDNDTNLKLHESEIKKNSKPTNTSTRKKTLLGVIKKIFFSGKAGNKGHEEASKPINYLVNADEIRSRAKNRKEALEKFKTDKADKRKKNTAAGTL